MKPKLPHKPFTHLLETACLALRADYAFAAEMSATSARAEVVGDWTERQAAALARELRKRLSAEEPVLEWVCPAADAAWAALRLPAEVESLLVATAYGKAGEPLIILGVLAARGQWTTTDREVIRHVAADAGLHHAARREAVTFAGHATGATEALAALRASEHRFRQLVESSDVIPWEAEVETFRYTYVGPQAEAILGYPLEDWLQPGFWRAHIHPEDRDWVLRYVDEQMRIAPHYDLEYRMLAADGRVVWLSEVVGMVLDENGDPQLRGTMRDITQRRHWEERLRFQNALLEAQSEASPDALLIISTEEKVITYNRRFVAMWGLDADDLGPRMPAEALLKLLAGRVADPAALRQRVRRLFTKSAAVERDEIRLRDGRVLERYTAPVRAADGTLHGRLWQYHDITERLAAERALRESEERFRLMVEGSEQVFFYVHDPQHRFEYLSPSVRDVLGYAPEDLLGRPYDVLLTGTEADDVVHSLTHEALESGARASTYTAQTFHKDGHVVVLELVEGPLLRDGKVVGVQGFARDITARVEAEKRMLHDALHDALTGLPNRALLMDRLQQALERGKRDKARPAVLFLDLDRFKVVNDSLGHLAGDRLLVELAERLAGCVGATDTVARMGGDEFVLLLESVHTVEEAVQVADCIQATLERPFRLDHQDVFTTGSIGITLADVNADQPESLLRNADIAMYRAKAAGGSSFQVFDSAMHEAAMRLLRLETDLRHALEKEEFRLVYQPVVNPATRTVAAVEALLRWQHPERGLLLPAEFIETAEDNGLIVPIGWWVLREACRHAAEWRRLPGLDALRMHVNLSARQLIQPNLLDHVDAALADAGLDAVGLVLEITESAIMDHEGTASETLLALRERGIGVCIDDFGVGYSSLGYLQSFRVDTLKIDRSFVARIGKDGKNVEIVRAVLTLAEHLGMDVVAEGVETEMQRTELIALGCTFAQGFLFAPPLEEAAVLRVLEEGEPIRRYGPDASPE